MVRIWPGRRHVAEVDHRGERRRLARARGADHEDEAALFHDEAREHRRQAQVRHLRDVGGDVADHQPARALLPEAVDAEIAEPRHGLREVELLVLGQDLLLSGVQHLVDDLLRLIPIHQRGVDGHDRALDLDADRRARRDEEVGGLLLGHQLQEFFDEHWVRS
jgi:hypothetical protein